MTTKNHLVKIAILIIFILFLSNCKIVFYAIEQGIGQLKLVHNSVPIKKIMQDSSYADSLKSKLLFVEEVKKFAIDSIGLKNSKNYTTLYDQKGEPIVWIVYAAPKYKMETYNWKYPVLGELPYIGYFKKIKAEKEAEKIKSKGYDVKIGTVSAWSTLGYFRDPILSNVLFRSKGELAELIIHELTHATLYVKGEAQFNENLATFVGVCGAKKFLISKYGKESPEYIEYIGELEDDNKLANYFLESSKKLDSLYKSFDSTTTDSQKEILKKEMIENIVLSMKNVDFFNKKIVDYYQSKIESLNNAFFALYITYYLDLSQFEQQYKNEYKSNLSNYIKFLTTKYKSV